MLLPVYFLPNPFPAHFFLNRSWIDVDNMPLKCSKRCDETVNYSRVWTERKTGLPLTIAISRQCHSKIIFLHLHAAFFYLVIWKQGCTYVQRLRAQIPVTVAKKMVLLPHRFFSPVNTVLPLQNAFFPHV